MVTLTTSQLAKAAGVNLEPVRYYERRGLIPEPPRRSSRYRQYSEDYIVRIRSIKRAQDLGFSLDEIADYAVRPTEIVRMLKQSSLLTKFGIVGTIVTALCCFTPILAILLVRDAWTGLAGRLFRLCNHSSVTGFYRSYRLCRQSQPTIRSRKEAEQ